MNRYEDVQPTLAEYAEIGHAFVMTLGVMSMLGHRSGAELGRYCQRPGTEFGDLVLDAFITANLGEVGNEARERVEAWVLARRVDALIAEAMAQGGSDECA